MLYRTLIYVAVCLFVPSFARAADLTFSQYFIADFEFDVLGNTPINPGGDTGFQPYQAAGYLTFTLDPSLNHPSQPTTVPFTSVTGTLDGVYPQSLLPYTISPVQFVGGDLTNIVRDGSGNVIGGNVSGLSMTWDLIADGGALTLFTTDGLPFDGSITSIPFSYGTVLARAAQFNVYLDVDGTNVLVALGDDRTLTAVPEPASITTRSISSSNLRHPTRFPWVPWSASASTDW
jgi:hypothetical protein